jgi:hypothetical protein
VTRDITASLRRAMANDKQWSPEEVRGVLSELAGAGTHRSLDWDEDAGEAWGRVVDDDGIVALVSARRPLILIRDSAAPSAGRLPWEAEIIPVASIEGAQLRADKATLVEALPDIAAQLDDEVSDFSTHRFSAEQLWFMTI